MQQLDIIFQDDQIMVINKPAGLVVTPSETNKVETLADILIRDYKINLDRGGIVHRLDKDTSGVMVIAKTEQALTELQRQFKERIVQKEYIALCHGTTEAKFKVDGAIARNPHNREVFTVLADGREASTDFELEKHMVLTEEKLRELFSDYTKIQINKLLRHKYLEFSRLHCFPHTGRTHQIRVHLKHLDHPLVADERYSGRKTVRLDHRWCPRQFLHAAKLSFDHPKTGERVTFESALPSDLVKALEVLSDKNS